MGDVIQIVIAIILIIGAFLLTNVFMNLRFKRACKYIIKDLKKSNSFNAHSAIYLPYESKDLLRIGIRDYRPKALQALMTKEVVARTENGKYYLLSSNTNYY